MQTYEVIIIGGGFLGVSTAYQLAKSGVKTLLIEAGDIGGGTSGSCSGRAQVCEGHLDDLNITLIREGLKNLETLEEELDFEFEWRRKGLFLLLSKERLWKEWQNRSKVLTENGIPTEIVDQTVLQKAEPNINTNGLLGAVYAVEGMVNPLRFTHAYANAAVRAGAKLLRNSPVIGMEVQNNRVTAVKTASETFIAEKVAVMTGAWESEVTQMAGVQIPIHSSHAESIITEVLPEMIFHNIGVSDNYDIINGKERAVAIGIIPEPNGTIEIAEAVFQTEELHHRVGAWGVTAMSKEIVKIFPFLRKVRVMRTWGRPTSFAPDEEPVIGWAPQLENMYVATSLVETITTVPLLSQWMSLMIQGKQPPISLDLYSPSRFHTT